MFLILLTTTINLNYISTLIWHRRRRLRYKDRSIKVAQAIAFVMRSIWNIAADSVDRMWKINVKSGGTLNSQWSLRG